MQDPRSAERLRAHFEIERKLAVRLRKAPPDERTRLYSQLYDELFRRVPDHPQLQRRANPGEQIRRVGRELNWLAPYLRENTTFLELGPGDCALSLAVAQRVARVYAVDVSAEIVGARELPGNLQFMLSDGVSIDLAPASVDLAYSNQLVEHLHPDDVRTQLANVWRALKPGGHYLCVTPNALLGPHDISKYFSDVAVGLHLVEYSWTTLADLMRQAGFCDVSDQVLPSRDWSPWEALLGALPLGLRRFLGRPWVLVRMLARK